MVRQIGNHFLCSRAWHRLDSTRLEKCTALHRTDIPDMPWWMAFGKNKLFSHHWMMWLLVAAVDEKQNNQCTAPRWEGKKICVPRSYAFKMVVGEDEDGGMERVRKNVWLTYFQINAFQNLSQIDRYRFGGAAWLCWSRRSRPRSHRKRTVTQTRRANVMLCRARVS